VPRPWVRTSRLYLAGSMALAVLAAALVRGYVNGAATASPGTRTAVLVAADRIARGSAVRPDQVTVERMPAGFAPPGTLTSVSQAAGRVALTDLSPGEVVTQTRLARVRAGPVASLVPQGLRAFAVPTSLPPGAVVPGDHVDILATYGTGGAGQPHTETVVEAVEVLFVLGQPGAGGPGSSSAIGLDAAAGGASASFTLMVLVAPDQQDQLAFARSFANLEVTIAPA
jgi:Flp pilus assembly protein CpaB